MEFVNTDTMPRSWHTLRAGDGSTLHLQPGETVDLELSSDFEDPYLKLKASKRESRAEKAKREKEETDAFGRLESRTGSDPSRDDNEKETEL